MKIKLSCHACGLQRSLYEPIEFELEEKLLFEFTCSNGHHNLAALDITKFSLLFDFGMLAFDNGFYREAVSSFATSLERLYEFYIRVICHHRQVPFDQIELAWKNVASQSERQLGAFHFLYTVETKQPAPVIHNNHVTFRNKVVHKGTLPTKKQTYDYANALHDYMMNLILQMNGLYPDSVGKTHLEEMGVRSNHNTNVWHNTIVNTYIPMIPVSSLDLSTFAEKTRKMKLHLFFYK